MQAAPNCKLIVGFLAHLSVYHLHAQECPTPTHANNVWRVHVQQAERAFANSGSASDYTCKKWRTPQQPRRSSIASNVRSLSGNNDQEKRPRSQVTRSARAMGIIEETPRSTINNHDPSQRPNKVNGHVCTGYPVSARYSRSQKPQSSHDPATNSTNWRNNCPQKNTKKVAIFQKIIGAHPTNGHRPRGAGY